jgi:hypothetical protein
LKPFVEAMKDQTAIGFPIDFEVFLEDRDKRFTEGNDKTWGRGNWVRCGTCLDTLGYPAYHHRDAHA